MKVNIQDIQKAYDKIPNIWKRGGFKQPTSNYDKLPENILFHDGWRDLIIPELGDNQKYGENYIDGNVVRKQVIDLTQEEIDSKLNEKKEQLKQDVQNKYNAMYKSALERVTGKKGDLSYLLIQKEEYQKKYDVSIKVLSDEEVKDTNTLLSIQVEMEFEDFSGDKLYFILQQFGLTPLNDRLKDFCQIIKFKYEYGEKMFNDFIGLLMIMRTRLWTDITEGLFDKYDQRMVLVNSITSDTPPNEIQGMLQQFLSI